MNDLTFDTVPCWYKLGWNRHTHSLHVHVSDATIASLPQVPQKSPLVTNAQDLIRRGSYQSFSPSLTTPYFGFDHTVRRAEERNDPNFVRFDVPLPRIYRPLGGNVCPECDGEGEAEADIRCRRCNGTKVEMTYDYDAAYRVTRNLQLLFWILSLTPDATVQRGVPQWFMLTLCADRGEPNGSSLGGDLSRDGLAILDMLIGNQKVSKSEGVKRMTASLRSAWGYMMGYQRSDACACTARFSEGKNLVLESPAGSVYTERQQLNLNRGCRIGCHGMESPSSALTCFAGLGAFSEICEEVWKRR